MSVDVRTTYHPDCDLCTHDGSPRLAEFNAPTRMGPWAHLCRSHMASVGIDTSVTERRVHLYGVPYEVLAIARLWCGRDASVEPVGDDTWRCRESIPEECFIYEVRTPGARTPVREDDGRPAGDVVLDEWTVRCVNDAPDAWFTVSAEGVYRGHREEARVW